MKHAIAIVTLAVMFIMMFTLAAQAVMPEPVKPPACKNFEYTGAATDRDPGSKYHAGFCLDPDKQEFWFYQHEEVEPRGWLSSREYQEWFVKINKMVKAEAIEVLTALKEGKIVPNNIKFEAANFGKRRDIRLSFSVDAEPIGFKEVRVSTTGYKHLHWVSEDTAEAGIFVVFTDRKPGPYSQAYIKVRMQPFQGCSINILDIL